MLYSVNDPLDSPDSSTPVLEPNPNFFKNSSTLSILELLTIFIVPTFEDLSMISSTVRFSGSCFKKSLKQPLKPSWLSSHDPSIISISSSTKYELFSSTISDSIKDPMVKILSAEPGS